MRESSQSETQVADSASDFPLAAGGRGATDLFPAPAVGREDGGGERSSLMSPEAAARALRAHAEAIIAAGVPVTLRVLYLIGDEELDAPAEGPEHAKILARARSKRYRERHANRHDQRDEIVTRHAASPSDSPGLNELPDQGSNKPETRENPAVSTGAREAGAPRARRSAPITETAQLPLGNVGNAEDPARGADHGQSHAPSRHASRKTSRVTRHAVPTELDPAWKPETDLVSALAVRFSVPEARILAEVPSFVRYWTKDRAGTRRARWGQTFEHRIADQAARGYLYAVPQSGARPQEIRQRTPIGSFDYSKVMAKPTNGAAK